MVRLYSTLNKLCTELSNKSSYQRNDKAQKNQTLSHPVGGFTFIVSLKKPRLEVYLHYWLSFINGVFVASSGTWKAMKVDRRPLSQTALSAIHLMCIAASLPTPPQGQGCPCRPLATHALFGISINECTLGSSGSDQMGSAGEAPSLWLRKEGRMQGPLPSGLLTFWPSVEKVTCTIIFGNEHVKACGQRGRESTFWFHKN